MCIGMPMQVISSETGFATCDANGEQRRVNTLFVGDQPSGTWLLVFLDSARQVLSELEAKQISDGLAALNAVMQGEENVDHLFPDLVDREPQLPDHLKHLIK